MPSIDSNSPRAWIASSMAHGYARDAATAIKHAQHAILIGPRNPVHWNTYTRMETGYLQEMRYDEAAEAANRTIELYSYMLPAYLVRAASCAHLDRLDEARAALKRALELVPELSISRLFEIYPIARYKNLESYLDGLRKAGLPE